MHLHTKILGPSCRLMCEPVGPSLCTHQGGHKILSKPEPFPNEILSRGRKWGREGLPHLHGSWEFGFLIPHPTDSPSERNRGTGHPRISADKKHLGSPGGGHSTLWEIPSSVSRSAGSTVRPYMTGETAFTHHLPESLLLLRALDPLGLLFSKIQCLRNHQALTWCLAPDTPHLI